MIKVKDDNNLYIKNKCQFSFSMNWRFNLYVDFIK